MDEKIKKVFRKFFVPIASKKYLIPYRGAKTMDAAIASCSF